MTHTEIEECFTLIYCYDTAWKHSLNILFFAEKNIIILESELRSATMTNSYENINNEVVVYIQLYKNFHILRTWDVTQDVLLLFLILRNWLNITNKMHLYGY
jgi:hypothetical protein